MRRRFLPERITQPKKMDNAEEREPERQHKGNDEIITNHNCFPFFRLNCARGFFTHLKPDSASASHTLAFVVPPEFESQRGVYLEYWTSRTRRGRANRDFMFRYRFDLFRCCLSVRSEFQKSFATCSVSDALLKASIHLYVESRERGCVLLDVGPLLASVVSRKRLSLS